MVSPSRSNYVACQENMYSLNEQKHSLQLTPCSRTGVLIGDSIDSFVNTMPLAAFEWFHFCTYLVLVVTVIELFHAGLQL